MVNETTTGRGGLALLLVATCLGGCASWRAGEPGPPIVGDRPRPIADRVVLEVDETGVAWSRGRMGEVTRQSLIELGSYREVLYADEPLKPPPLRLAIAAVGSTSENSAASTGKKFFIGVLVLLPGGVVTFEKNFTVEARATFSRKGQVLQQIDLANSARLNYTLLYDRGTAEKTLGEAMFQHLAAQLAVRLAPVSALGVDPSDG